MKDNSLHFAFRTTLPILAGYFAIGIPFGILVVKTGYPWWVSPLTSLLMYAGAGQYMIIGLFAANAPLPAILTAELILNLRHIVYGFSLIGKFKEMGKLGWQMAYELSDETYALLAGLKAPENISHGKFYSLISLLNHSYWFIATLIGAIAGELIPYDFNGIDFSLKALFAVIFCNQIMNLWKERHDTN